VTLAEGYLLLRHYPQARACYESAFARFPDLTRSISRTRGQARKALDYQKEPLANHPYLAEPDTPTAGQS
jgi:hypothetical protein